jgi:hypothetical protein
MMNFILTTKMYTRLRLINANQGHLVQIYYDESAKSQDPPTQKSPLWISTHSEKSHGKFEENKVSMYIFDPIGYLNVKAAIYLVTFVLRFRLILFSIFAENQEKFLKSPTTSCSTPTSCISISSR